MVESGYDPVSVCVGCESSLRVFVSGASEVLYPHWVALSLMGTSPRPASFSGRCTPLVEKLGSRHMTCLMALLSMPSMAVSCRSLKTPRCTARYFDLRSCSTTSVVYVGMSFLLDNADAIFLSSLLMYVWCSLKSSTVLM